MKPPTRSMSTCCLVLFTKAARPGRVKTRLVGTLTAQQTAALHDAFVDDVASSLRQGAFQLTVAWGSDDGGLGDLPSSLGGLPAEPQHPGDLGQRLAHGLASVARRFESVAAVGSDHPEMHPDTVNEAFEHLEHGADVVIVPADDGGYVLIAVRREALRPELFQGIPWSTSEVLARTTDRCHELGLRLHLMPEGHDIDLHEDLLALVDRMRRDPSRCPATRRLLETWGYLP